MTKQLLSLLSTCALLAACKSVGYKEKGEVILSKGKVHEALSQAKPPQQFGYNIYSFGKGIAMTGNPRLHPRHMAKAHYYSDDFPIIKVNGSASRMEMMVLVDTSIMESWVEFGHAMEFKTSFLGLDGRTIPYRGTAFIGQAEAYAAIIPQIRIDNFFIEDTAVFVRMAANSLGPLSRGIMDPEISGILGYDLLSNMEFIRFNIEEGSIEFSATTPYTPDEANLIGTASIVSIPNVGLAVEGMVDSKATPVILDFAGNYFLARNDATINSTKMVSLGEVVYVNAPTMASMTPDGLPRAGLRMLQRYVVTICPRSGKVYFERPAR